MCKDNEKVNCIGCGCCDGICGFGINVQKLMQLYDDFLDGREEEVKAQIAEIPEEHRPDKCFGCGRCQFACPENIETWKTLGKFAKLLK